MGKRSFEHTVQLCLAPELRSALIKYMGKHDLDKEYAGLSLLVKSMRSEGLITQEIYDVYLAKYSKTVTSLSTLQIESKPKNKFEMQEKQKIEEITRHFEAVLRSEWAAHPSLEWRHKTLLYAEKWQDKVPAAKLLIERFSDKVLGAGQN